MATLEMSAAFASGYVNRMHTLGTIISASSSGTTAAAATTSAAQCGILTSGSGQPGWANTYFYIMKGTVPVDFSTLVNFNARSADVLITFATANLAAGDFLPTNPNIDPSLIQTNYVNAAATGTATWFWWNVQAQTFSGTNFPILQIIGTVGTVGSGADLEIPSISIVAANPYRVSNIRLDWPTSWTY
jgi:hypothetical protein